MMVNIDKRAEPLPGYKLIERLGGGGFGEVWKAEAPGGLYKAIKFVFGDIDSVGDDGARAEQELRSLKRLKEVRHPYILTIERYDIINGQLMIVMELADKTLWDRFKEYRQEGISGIPRVELLGYMRETAEALDLMNLQFQLQHLDIKPQNLFLVYNHVKVADFGLIKDLKGTVASVTGGVTPVYAAPETFDGRVSRATDQYSLAIVYQELLTGHRPFGGTTARQLVLQHLQAEPDLSSLPIGDRPIVHKALSKDYEERFKTCREFVEDLIKASPNRSNAVDVDTPFPPATNDHRATGGPPALPGSNPNGAASHSATINGFADDQTSYYDGGITDPWHTNGDAAGHAFGQIDQATEDSLKDRLSAVIGGFNSATLEPELNPKKTRGEPPATSEDGILMPALVIGLGSFGQAILKQLRLQLQEEFGGFLPLPNIRLLYLDTDAAAIAAATQGGNHALRFAEVLHTRLHRASHYLKQRDFAKNIGTWLPQKMLYRIPRQPTTTGIRALGRLALADNYRLVSKRIESEIEACLDGDLLRQGSEIASLGVYATKPRIYIVANLGGGTGGGMCLDLAYLIQNQLKKYNLGDAQVIGVFLGPQHCQLPQQNAEAANFYAALMELDHFRPAESFFSAVYPDKGAKKGGVFRESGPPFHRCMLIPVRRSSRLSSVTSKVDELGLPVSSSIVRTANLLATDLVTAVGRKADEFRDGEIERIKSKAKSSVAPMIYQTVGSYQINCPRKQLLRRAARKLCRRLIERWMSKDARPLKGRVQQWVAQNWAQLELSSDEVILRLQYVCKKKLGIRPDTLFQQKVNAILDAGAKEDGNVNSNSPAENGFVKLNIGRAVKALEELEKLLGVPDGCQPLDPETSSGAHSQGAIPDFLEKAAKTFGADAESSIAEMIVRLIETPDSRLAGAEESIRQLGEIVQDCLTHQEHLAQELRERSAVMYQQIMELMDQVDKLPDVKKSWAFSFTRRTSPAKVQLSTELLELLKTYPKIRYQSLVLQYAGSFYLGLRGVLSEQLREVDFCRQRLTELDSIFAASIEEERKFSGDDETDESWHKCIGKTLLPDGCASLDAAANNSIAEFSTEDMLKLDHGVETVIRKQFRALVYVCLASSHVIRNLIPVMQAVAEAFLNDVFDDMDVIQMFLREQQPNVEDANIADESVDDDSEDDNISGKTVQERLLSVFNRAKPAFVAENDPDELCILGAPTGPMQENFHDEVDSVLRDKLREFSDVNEEIVVYRERVFASLAELKQVWEQAKEAYDDVPPQQFLSPHSRLDLPFVVSFNTEVLSKK